MSKLFTVNELAINIDVINIIKSITDSSPQYRLNIEYNNKYIEESVNKNFFGLKIGNDFNWKNHIE
jgi:hypothetical protein